MTYDPATLPAAYTHVALETASSVGSGLGTHPVALHEVDREQIRGIRSEIGITPGVANSMGYIRLSDNAGLGLWVPMSALGGTPSLIYNRNFDHFQRVGSSSQTSTTTYSVSTSYAADGFFVLPAGASVTQARSTTVPNARSAYSLAVTGAASVTTVDIGQRIRSAIVNTRGQQSLLFSCYVRNESGASYTPTLRIGTPGGVDSFGTVTNRLAQTLQACADSAWTRVYHVFDPSAYTNIANGMEVCLRIPSGSSVAGDTNRIAQFDLRPATQLIDFVPPDPDEELLRCLSYCEVIGLSPGSTNTHFALGRAASTTVGLFNVNFATKWTTPSMVLSAVTDFQVDDGSVTPECSALTFDQGHLSGGRLVSTTAATLTANRVAFLRADTTNAARMMFIAAI